jgi:replicative DNA helicase
MTVLAPDHRDLAEQSVLGAAIIYGTKALDAIADERLRPEHFRRPEHQALLAGMFALKDAGSPIDRLTLQARFAGVQSPVSPLDIDLLAGSVVDIGNLRAYCGLVREEAWYDDAEYALYDARDAWQRRDRDALISAVARIDNAQGPDTEVDAASEFLDWYDTDKRGWPFPFPELTEASGGGMQPGETTVLGGWSGMGKTFLLSQMLRSCVKAGARVHEYANEMHGPKRTIRTLVSLTGIPASDIERRDLDADEMSTIKEALKRLPYETTATAGWRVEDYCRDLRRKKWDVAAIDTVTNLPCSRVDEWDKACVMLADAAAQAGTHLIEVSQLNLERDKGKKPPPVGRDIRNTGAWVQRARIVMFIHRDQQSRNAGDDTVIWEPELNGHVRIEKASHGDPSKGFAAVRFNPRWMRFDQMASRHLEVAA